MSARATFWAWEVQVPSSEKLVLLCLADCHNADTGQCNPSVNYICKKTSLARGTVLKSLKELNDLKIISRKKVTGSSNWYTIHMGSINIDTSEVSNLVPPPVSNLVPKPTSKPKKNLRWENGDLETAESIYKLLLALNPKHKKPSMETWANTIRLMRESDGHTHNDIMNLFRFANSDSFWKSNILSPAKLREKWDVLTIKKGGTSAPTENIWV